MILPDEIPLIPGIIIAISATLIYLSLGEKK